MFEFNVCCTLWVGKPLKHVKVPTQLFLFLVGHDCVALSHVHYSPQQPEIDSSSDEGIIPDKFDSAIEFNNVHFSYPTRPDIQVSESSYMYVLTLCVHCVYNVYMCVCMCIQCTCMNVLE